MSKSPADSNIAFRWHGLPVYAADYQPAFKIQHSEAEWRALLGDDVCYIVRNAGTEAPGTGAYVDAKGKGKYYSAATGQLLFDTSTQFHSGTGWPSFTDPVNPDAIILRGDNSYGMVRIEVLDSSSGAHLGHVFDDGPGANGLRYCINSKALIFVPKGGELPQIVKDYESKFGAQAR